MRGKAHHFNDFLSNTNNTIICCTETHFDESTTIEPFIAGTPFICNFRNRPSHGGGVAIFHHANLCFTTPYNFPYSTMNIESTAIINSKFLICTIYWPPQSNVANCEELDLITSFLNGYRNSHTIILIRDFNLPGIKWRSDYDDSSQTYHKLDQ